MLGYVYAEKGEFPKAIDAFHEVLKLEPGYVRAVGALSGCYEKMGSYEDALKYCERAIRMEPQNAKHLYFLSDIYFLQKHFPEALESFRKAIELDTDGKYADYREYYAEQYISILNECGLHDDAKAELDALRKRREEGDTDG